MRNTNKFKSLSSALALFGLVFSLGNTTNAADAVKAKRAVEGVTVSEQCADPKDRICTPKRERVAELCSRQDQNVALKMFNRAAPWTRAYLRHDIEVLSYRGRRQRPQQLRFAEEVIIVANKAKSRGGFQVSGMGSYDVLRWNGKCATVMADEVVFRAPGLPNVATLAWGRINKRTRDAVLDSRKTQWVHLQQRRTCKKYGRRSTACDEAKNDFSRIAAIRLRSNKRP